MINTPAFESLERYMRLEKALDYLLNKGRNTPYYWMRSQIIYAMNREVNFMVQNRENREKERAQ